MTESAVTVEMSESRHRSVPADSKDDKKADPPSSAPSSVATPHPPSTPPPPREPDVRSAHSTEPTKRKPKRRGALLRCAQLNCSLCQFDQDEDHDHDSDEEEYDEDEDLESNKGQTEALVPPSTGKKKKNSSNVKRRSRRTCPCAWWKLIASCCCLVAVVFVVLFVVAMSSGTVMTPTIEKHDWDYCVRGMDKPVIPEHDPTKPAPLRTPEIADYSAITANITCALGIRRTLFG